jgi:hypothetical protein
MASLGRRNGTTWEAIKEGLTTLGVGPTMPGPSQSIFFKLLQDQFADPSSAAMVSSRFI